MNEVPKVKIWSCLSDHAVGRKLRARTCDVYLEMGSLIVHNAETMISANMDDPPEGYAIDQRSGTEWSQSGDSSAEETAQRLLELGSPTVQIELRGSDLVWGSRGQVSSDGAPASQAPRS